MRRWRNFLLRRGRFTWAPPPDQAVPLALRQATRKAPASRRGRFTSVPLVGAAPPAPPPAVPQTARIRVRLAVSRRGRFSQPPWPQIAPPAAPAAVPQVTRAVPRRVVRPARGRFTSVPPAPGLPPAGITRRRPAAPSGRRARFAAVPPPGAPAAPSVWRPGVTRPSTRRLVRPRRARFAEPVWPFVPPPPFSIGTLTAADQPGAVLTAAGAANTLTATTAPQGTLTAADQRTGGPA